MICNGSKYVMNNDKEKKDSNVGLGDPGYVSRYFNKDIQIIFISIFILHIQNLKQEDSNISELSCQNHKTCN